MDESKAREILKDWIKEDQTLYHLGCPYLMCGQDFNTLDGDFDLDELEAIAWWMRNKGEK